VFVRLAAGGGSGERLEAAGFASAKA
jgi:hypothetical protein